MLDLNQCECPQCVLVPTISPNVYKVCSLSNVVMGTIRINDQISGRIDPLIEIFQFVGQDFCYISCIRFRHGETILYPSKLSQGMIQAQRFLIKQFKKTKRTGNIEASHGINFGEGK